MVSEKINNATHKVIDEIMQDVQLNTSGTPLFWTPSGTVLSVLIKGVLISGAVLYPLLLVVGTMCSVLIKGDVLISGVSL